MKLNVEHLSFSYGERTILHDVSFQADEGDFLAVLGPNGVGKSTLFRCILGLSDRYDGEIRLDDRDIRSLSRRELAGKMAYIPQNHGTAFNYSVLDTVLMGTTHQMGTFSSPREAEIRQAYSALEQVGIAHLAERTYSRLSGGEQQMVMITRALSQKAKLLIMDEPTASLDFGNQEKTLSLMKSLAEQGYTVVISTHNPQQALSYCGKTLALCDGKVAAFDITRNVITDELLSRLYGIRAAVIETPYGTLIGSMKG